MASILYKGTNGVGGSGNTIYAFSDGTYTWQAITADTTAQDNYAYLVDSPDPVVILPPSSPNVGDSFLVMSINGIVAFDFKINGEYSANVTKTGIINATSRFFYTGATYGWACENASDFGVYFVSDPYFPDVALYLRADDNDLSTNIIDESTAPVTVGMFGNTKISTEQSKYGGSSIYFDGSGDYLRCDAALQSLTEANIPFCLEAWIYPTGGGTTPSTRPFVFGLNRASNGENTFIWGILDFTNESAFWVNNFSPWPATPSLTYNTWTHVAITYSGSSFTVFYDGVQVFTYNVALTTPLNECVFGIGAEFDSANGGSVANYFEGYLDSVRLTVNTARYTTNFDPEIDTYLAY